MRRHHNPRYAPESLERKLHPSGITGIPVTAEVYSPTTNSAEVASVIEALASDSKGTLVPSGSNFRTDSGPTTTTTTTTTIDPVPTIGDPPVILPNIPSGPDLPV